MAESRRYYHGGKTLVVDRLVELKRSGSVERMKSSLGIAMNQRELDRLRNELENMGADGVISPAEKQSLKREWGNLESSYYKTSGQFSDDPDLSGSAPWALLAPAFATLSSIMEKVLADMDSSYTDADLAQIDDLFYSCWTYINRCSALYDSRSSFGSRYELRFVGNREFNGSTTINVVVYSKTLGQNVAFPASEFDWFYSDTGDKVATGTLNPTFTTAMLGSGTSMEIWCQWTHDISSETGEESGTSVARLVAFITLSIAKITQFQWSNAEKEGQLNKDSSAWSDTRPDQPDGVQYVWIRESEDDGKTWTYYRETGLVGPEGPQGETGPQGPQGPQGEPGEDGKSPEYLYKYTKTSEKDAYKTGAAGFVYGGRLMTYGGTALTAGMGGWSKTLPDGPQYADDHLWMKIINPDGTETIVPPASECSISIQGQTSYQADRHVASADQTLEYAVTRNKIDVGECQWCINAEAYNLGCGFLSDSDTPPAQTATGEAVKVFVPMGFDLRQFTVTALVIYVSASITVSEANAVANREYLGIYPQTIDGVEYRFPTTAKDGKPLMPGDSITMREKDAEGNVTGTDVYVYMGIKDGQPVWTNDVNDMPADKIYEIAMDSNYDISSLANQQGLEPVTQGAAWLFQRNIVAFNMFAQRMFAEEIIIQAGGSIHSNTYDGDGNRIAKGPGFYLGDDGVFKAVQAELVDIVATSGSFSGQFTSTAFMTVDASDAISSANVKDEYKEFWDNATSSAYDMRFSYNRPIMKFNAPSSAVVVNMFAAEDQMAYVTLYFNGGTYIHLYFMAYNGQVVEHDIKIDNANKYLPVWCNGNNGAYVMRQNGIVLYNWISGSPSTVSSSSPLVNESLSNAGIKKIGNAYVLIGELHNQNSFYSTNMTSWTDMGAPFLSITRSGDEYFAVRGIIESGAQHATLVYFGTSLGSITENRTIRYSQHDDEYGYTAYDICANSDGYVAMLFERYQDSIDASRTTPLFMVVRASDLKTERTLSADTILYSDAMRHPARTASNGTKFFHLSRTGEYFRDIIQEGSGDDVSFTYGQSTMWNEDLEFGSPNTKDMAGVILTRYGYVCTGAKGVSVFPQATTSTLARFFSSIRSKVVDGTAVPSYEPLSIMHEVSGTFVDLQGNTKTITRMRVYGNGLYIETDYGLHTYQFGIEDCSKYEITIKNLVVAGDDASFTINNMLPMDDAVDIGNEDNRFHAVHAETVYSDVNEEGTQNKVWGAVFN